MKIGTISDLHIDRHPKLEPQAYLDALVYIVEQRNIELLLIAGDMSNDYLQSYQFIQDLKKNVVYQSYSSLVIMTIGLQKHHSVQSKFMNFMLASQTV